MALIWYNGKNNPDIQPSHGNIMHLILTVPLILLMCFVDFFLM